MINPYIYIYEMFSGVIRSLLLLTLCNLAYSIRQAAGATDGDPDGDGQLTVPIGVSFFLWLLHASSLPLLGEFKINLEKINLLYFTVHIL